MGNIKLMKSLYEDMLRFLKDASEYGTYYQELAKLLAPDLGKQMHICEVGSGLGYLSLALARWVEHVTFVDKDTDSVESLAGRCTALCIGNITPRWGSVQDLPLAEKYHAMVFSFLGEMESILKNAKKQCIGKVFFIAGHCTSRVDDPLGDARAMLHRLNIPFTEELHALEFGQPFRHFQDARRYFEIYTPEQGGLPITDDFVRSQTVETGRMDFPLYLSRQRVFSILKMNTSDIPENME